MASLEDQAFQFWNLMQKMKHSPHIVSRVFARDNQLPTLAAQTNYQKLKDRIHRETKKEGQYNDQ